MDVLVVGNGGREHALALALQRSSRVDRIFATRPNAGMANVSAVATIQAKQACCVPAHAHVCVCMRALSC